MALRYRGTPIEAPRPSDRRALAAVYRVESAKQVPTRARRLARLIEDSAAGRKIGPLRRPGK